MAYLLTAKKIRVLLDELDKARFLREVQRSVWISKRGYPSFTFRGKNRTLHRFILGVGDSSIIVDHANKNPLDNRRENLRVVTKAQNAWNAKPHRDSVYGAIGLQPMKNRPGKWRATIMTNGKLKHLGVFNSKLAAIRARKKAERERWEDIHRYPLTT